MSDKSIEKEHPISYQEIVNQRIDDLIEASGYPRNPVGLPEFPQLIPIKDSTPWMVGTEPTQSSKQEIMLASVPKVAISLAMVRILETLGIKERRINLDVDTIIELLGRDPDSIFNPESNQYRTYEELRELLSSSPLDIKFEDINSTDKFQLKKQEIKDALKDLKVSVDLNELLRQILTLSSNSATRIAKQLIVQNGRDIDEELKQLVPQYSPSPADMSKLQHYETEKPNVGPIYEHAEMLDDLVKRVVSGGESQGERMLVDSLTNNRVDFSFDFTNSDLGKKLMSMGYRIVEKTGYYPCVYWVKAFADPKNPKNSIPPHMVMCTIFSIISPEPENKVISTFAHQRLFAVRLPIETSEMIIDGQKVEEPDEHGGSYTAAYINFIKREASEEFRKECAAAVLELEEINRTLQLTEK